ncbi:MAG: aminotransferase class III-fold pyridoxal phosphate-dependent enzyme [Mesorhizobium sp.]|nr:MAG: aminotransferase class III-fold pyridoxal phosphate-dependent enzyme [Mesorhizobium sp.]
MLCSPSPAHPARRLKISLSVAAFIGEPILGTGGIVPPPATGRGSRPVLKKYDVLLVADEVVTAFRRMVTMFGADRYGVKLDLITIAKGLASAYAPLSGVIGRAMPQGDILGLVPPLYLTREQSDIVASKTAYAVRGVFANV